MYLLNETHYSNSSLTISENPKYFHLFSSGDPLQAPVAQNKWNYLTKQQMSLRHQL